MMASLRKLKIKLNEGEVICSRCKGRGYEFRKAGWGKQERLSCALCDSIGKFDWIKNIIGPNAAMPQQYWLERSFLRISYDWISDKLQSGNLYKVENFFYWLVSYTLIIFLFVLVILIIKG